MRLVLMSRTVEELECARKVRAVVMLSQSAQRQQRVGIGKRPAPPTVGADRTLELSDRLPLNRFAVES